MARQRPEPWPAGLAKTKRFFPPKQGPAVLPRLRWACPRLQPAALKWIPGTESAPQRPGKYSLCSACAMQGSGFGQDIGCSQQTPSRPTKRLISSLETLDTPIQHAINQFCSQPPVNLRQWLLGSSTQRAWGSSHGETILGNV